MLDMGPAVLLFYGFEYNPIIGLTNNLIFRARPASDVDLFVLVFVNFDDHMPLSLIHI